MTVDVENGRRVIFQDFTIYEPVESEILGRWEEILRVPCDGGEPVPPASPLSLWFTHRSETFLDWRPEVAEYDHRGSFTHDQGDGALWLSLRDDAEPPADLDGEGTASIVDDRLVLEDMWLGTTEEGAAPGCGHVFELD